MWHFYKLKIISIFIKCIWVNRLFVYNQWACSWCNDFHTLLRIILENDKNEIANCYLSVYPQFGKMKDADCLLTEMQNLDSVHWILLCCSLLPQILPLQLVASKYTRLPLLLYFSYRIIPRDFYFIFFHSRIILSRLFGISKNFSETRVE